jgi:uncharacterized membrane protein YfcA
MFFVVGFLVGFVDPLAGVGCGVLSRPLAVGLLGVMLTWRGLGGSSWRRLLRLGLSRRGLLRLVAYAGAAVSLGAFLGVRLGLFLAGVGGWSRGWL